MVKEVLLEEVKIVRFLKEKKQPVEI